MSSEQQVKVLAAVALAAATRCLTETMPRTEAYQCSVQAPGTCKLCCKSSCHSGAENSLQMKCPQAVYMHCTGVHRHLQRHLISVPRIQSRYVVDYCAAATYYSHSQPGV